MRKILLPLIILLLATAGKAQYVNIPDSNFRNFLVAKYPACFNASGQMDTTCGAVVNEKKFNLQCSTDHQSILSFDGFQYFKKVNQLVIDGGSWSFDTLKINKPFYPPNIEDIQIYNVIYQDLFLDFPKTLKGLDISDMSTFRIHTNDTLPNSLKYYSVKNNWVNGTGNLFYKFPDSLENFSSTGSMAFGTFDTIPNMPNTLKYFSCTECRVNKMGSLSTNLEELDLSGNYGGILSGFDSLPIKLKSLKITHSDNLTSLPTIPNSLKHLDVNYCKISTLPALPNTLNHLSFSNNQITTISSLPDSLVYLDCGYNKIKNLPSLPVNLTYLDCYLNKSLAVLPTLPNKLEILFCQYDSLSILPSLPNTIIDLRCEANNLTSLPALPTSLKLLQCGNVGLNCLPQLPNSLEDLELPSGNTIRCLPNFPSNCAIYNYDSMGNRIFLPLCNPTNNINHCQFSPIVYGKVFTDNNLNGIKDANEFYRSKVKLKLTSNNRAIFTNASGSYTSQIDSIGSYTLKVEVPPLYSVVSDSINFNFTVYDTVYILPDIALQPNTVKDSLSINITPINWRARPGFSFPYLISYENIGTTTISPTISFNYDTAKMMYDSSSNASVVNTGDSLSLNVGSIVPGAVNSFVAYFRVKSTVPIGDTVVVTATATNAENVKLVSNVGGSFDPNDKQATPAITPTQVALGKYIDYTIRFQNTGNDTAFTVVIADTLSSNLQASTLQMVGSSHNCKTTVVGNIVYFEFMNIKLADSIVNEKASHGFVSFKIKPKATLTNGNSVSNKAFIYFDYNAAVATNTAVTQIKNSLLPVRITNYEASPTPPKEGLKNWTVLNKWTTSNEINASHFVIQRSEDGRVFKSVGTVAAKGIGSYSFLDGVNSLLPFPLGEGLGVRLYYRLQIINKDGSYSFSEIKQIRLNELMDKQINIYPNPATTFVNIECKDAKQILIIDYFGRTIQQFNNVTEHQTINTKQLNKGLYLVKVITNRGEVKTEKLIVQ